MLRVRRRRWPPRSEHQTGVGDGSSEGSRLQAGVVRPEQARAGSRAALKVIGLHFHDLRHEAGSRLLEAGWPLHHVQHMLGHANVSQTSTYLNATRVGLQESMRRMDSRENALQGTSELPAQSVAIVEAPSERSH